MDNTDNYFVERVENVSYANGVFRVTFGAQEEDGEPNSVVRLMIPANQLSPILQGMANAAKDIDKKVQARVGALATGDDAAGSTKAADKKRAALEGKK